MKPTFKMIALAVAITSLTVVGSLVPPAAVPLPAGAWLFMIGLMGLLCNPRWEQGKSLLKNSDSPLSLFLMQLKDKYR